LSHNTLCGAGIINTSLSRHFLGTGHFAAIKQKAFGILGSPWLKTVPQGAATSITAAVSPDLESHSGEPALLSQCLGLIVHSAFDPGAGELQHPFQNSHSCCPTL